MILRDVRMNTRLVRIHWFFFAAPIVIALDVYAGVSARGVIDRLLEAGLLFDLVVLVPCLYWLCYRHRGRKAVIRAAAIACLGVWAALKLVPEPQRELLNYFVPLRYLGIAALGWLELLVVIGICRNVFKGGSVDQAVEQAPAGMPPWVTKLLAMEAKFWLKVWSAMKRFVGRW